MYCGGELGKSEPKAAEAAAAVSVPEGATSDGMSDGSGSLVPEQLRDVPQILAEALLGTSEVEVQATPALSPADLRRGSGPFGPRDAPHRLLLLPDKKHREESHWLRHRVADVLGIDLYTAKTRLVSDVPICLADGESHSELGGQAARLREVGIRVALISPEDTVCGESFQFPTAAEDLGKGKAALAVAPSIRFFQEQGPEFLVLRADFSWLALASIESDGHKAVGAPLGAAAGRRSSAARSPRLSLAGMSYLCLAVCRKSKPEPLFLRSDCFDFGCLGEARSLAAGINMRQMAAWLSPDALVPLPLDEGFKRVKPGPVRRRGREDGRSRSWQVAMRQLEFAEYVVLLDAIRRRK